MTPAPTNNDAETNSMRRLVFEALQMRLAAEGIPVLPDKLAASIADRALAELKASPTLSESTLSLSNTQLLNAVSVSFSTVLSQYTEPQRMALRMGLDPSNPATLAMLATPGGLARLMQGQNPDIDAAQVLARSGRRYSDMRGDDFRSLGQRQFAGLNLDSDTVSVFSDTGLSRKTFDDLSRRYSVAEIKSAASYAGEMEVNASNFAGKFIKLDKNERESLHSFVDDIKAKDGLSAEEKTRRINEYRKAHRDIAKVLSEKDMFTIVNSRNKNAAEQNIDKAAETSDKEVKAPADAATAVKASATDAAARQTKQEKVVAVDDVFGEATKKDKTKPAEQSVRKLPAAAPT